MPVDFMKINIKVVSFLTHFRCSSRQRPGGDVACFCSLRNFRCLECGSLLHVAGGILSFVIFIGNIHTPPHQLFLHIWLLTLRVPSKALQIGFCTKIYLIIANSIVVRGLNNLL